jgi:hydroxypyruvate reductase
MSVLGNPEEFLRALFAEAVASVQADRVIARFLPSPPSGRTIVLGAGKAAGAMARAVERHWPHTLEGLVIVPDGYARDCDRISVVAASHPVPDARGLAATERILSLAREAGEDDLVLALISGGASALMVAPAPGMTLAEKQSITAALLRSGASIAELNCVRKHLSAIKGGRLARAAAPARVATLIVSDVVGDDVSVIASGPTIADPTTCADALAVLERYAIALPAHIRTLLEISAVETPKILPPSAVQIIARPADALAAAATFARGRGLAVHDLGDAIAGEARVEAETQAALIRRIAAGRGPVRPPCVVLSGGEVVVTMRGQGRGGPNTEFALAFALACDVPNVWLLAADTDGRDGASGAAGAVLGPGLLSGAQARGSDPARALAANDSGGFFAAFGGLFDPGPTFTNVNDLRAILVLPP